MEIEAIGAPPLESGTEADAIWSRTSARWMMLAVYVLIHPPTRTLPSGTQADEGVLSAITNVTDVKFSSIAGRLSRKFQFLRRNFAVYLILLWMLVDPTHLAILHRHHPLR